MYSMILSSFKKYVRDTLFFKSTVQYKYNTSELAT